MWINHTLEKSGGEKILPIVCFDFNLKFCNKNKKLMLLSLNGTSCWFHCVITAVHRIQNKRSADVEIFSRLMGSERKEAG